MLYLPMRFLVIDDSRPAGEGGIRWVADLRQCNDPQPVLLVSARPRSP
jgi:hypothetical protein